MGNRVFQTVTRPRNPGINGTIFTIDHSDFEWFDKFLHKYSDTPTLRKMLRKFPRIGAIEVYKEGQMVALVTIEPKGNNQYIVSHFSDANDKADFSMLMTRDNFGMGFKDLSPEVNRENFKQVGNFVVGVYMYAHLMHVDAKCKKIQIEPVEVFGQALV